MSRPKLKRIRLDLTEDTVIDLITVLRDGIIKSQYLSDLKRKLSNTIDRQFRGKSNKRNRRKFG